MEIIKLSIIIVNYNGKHFLKKCLDSIARCCSSFSYEIIIVDNNSVDDSQKFIRKNYPNVKLLQEKKNLGFGKANNLGVKNSIGHYVLLLNNDTILQQNIEPVLEVIAKKHVGAVGVKMLNGNKKYIQSVGKFPSPLSLIKISNLNETRTEFVLGNFENEEYEVDWISGSFMVLKRKDWDLLNGFDEDFFMYVEDVDLCKRINNLGKKIIFLSNISYIHFVGFNSSREIKLIDGYKIYSNKHFSTLNNILAQFCLKINYVYKKKIKSIC